MSRKTYRYSNWCFHHFLSHDALATITFAEQPPSEDQSGEAQHFYMRGTLAAGFTYRFEIRCMHISWEFQDGTDISQVSSTILLIPLSYLLVIESGE